ncbi:aminotransferase [Myxozyma melibiosi]|uniref:Branched-chain-amino-acid aminotransferase n=1 Tax=Myxozyma melibiosi TaxID=54550 RepID=A0ABR1F628_9ASCO
MLKTLSRRLSSSAAKPQQLAQRLISSFELPEQTGAPLSVAKLAIEKTTTPKEKLAPEKLVFGHTFTDHMLQVPWSASEGWLEPKIVPYQNLSLDPATCVFHYAFECFEGMKAYRDNHGKIRMFRPDKNMERMKKTAARICLPTFDSDELTKLIAKLVELDSEWIPSNRGYSLYLRPTMIGTQASLGVNPPSSALLYVIMSPVGPYYPTGFKAVRLEATDYAIRAWPGGVGDKKLGANYAPGILPQRMAASRGFQQNLWLFGEEGYVTEVGTMNAFFVFKNGDKKELVTAPIDGTILEGVTRDSILALARERFDPAEWDISERKFTMKEVADRAKAGTLLEAFGSGTAAVVSPIKEINWHGEAVNVPLQEGKESGVVAETMANWIAEIQYGEKEHPWSYVIE